MCKTLGKCSEEMKLGMCFPGWTCPGAYTAAGDQFFPSLGAPAQHLLGRAVPVPAANPAWPGPSCSCAQLMAVGRLVGGL